MSLEERGNMFRLFDDSALATAAHVLTAGPISRADAARELSLSGATLTRLVRPLVDSGMVTDSQIGTPQSGIGRPTQLLEVPSDAHHFIGINLTTTTAYGVVTDTQANPLVALSEPLNSHDPHDGAAQINELIGRLTEASPSPHFEHIGISAGGHIAHNRVVDSRFLEWHNVDLAAMLGGIGARVHVLNDIVALTMLEQWFGLGRKESNFIITTVGAGIGHGIVHNRRAVDSRFEGYSSTSHIPLFGAKGVCQYGHVGCANGVLTTPAVLSRAAGARSIANLDSGPNSLEQLIELAQSGDPSCQFAISEFGTNLSTYVQTVCGAAMVTDVILDGEAIALLDTPWADTFTDSIAQFKSPNLPGLTVHKRDGSFDRWAQGAATGAIVSWLEEQVLGE